MSTMEQILRARFQSRQKRLTDCMSIAETTIESFKGGNPLTLEEFTKIRLSLQQALDCYKEEIHQLMSRSDALPILIDVNFEEQNRAEGFLLELNILNQETTSHTSPVASLSSSRLPKLDLIKFNGDILKFKQFWDIFEANVNNKPLPDVEKLAYLLGALEGKAREAVEGLSIENANYTVAVETLQKQFGSKERIVDAHYMALSAIKRCSYNYEDCRKTLNSIQQHIRVLHSLGENVENNHFRSLIMSKFPGPVLYELKKLSLEEKSIANIREALENLTTAMEDTSKETNNIISEDKIAVASTTEALHVREKQKRSKFIRPSFSSGIRKRKATGNHIFKNKKRKKCCIFCKEDHYNDECTVVKDLQERKLKIKDRCFNCLFMGHKIKDCKRPKYCHHCSGPHNRALCPKKATSKYFSIESTSNLLQQNIQCVSYLQTATAQALHNKRTCHCRVLLDCGSQRSYITNKLVKQLNIIPEREDLLMIYTFGDNKPKETLSPSTDITLETKRGIKRKITVNVVPHITDRLPIPKVKNTELVDVMADNGSAGEGVDILIGNDYYFSFMRHNNVSLDHNLYLIDSDFGWIVSGRQEDNVNRHEGDILSVLTYHHSSYECPCFTEPDLPLKNLDIKFLWTLENIGITDPIKATREEEAIQHFNSTVKYQDGRYYVKWPWTQYPPNLPTNYGLAYGRLKGLLQRLDQSTIQEYDKILNEQLEKNIIEVIEIQPDIRMDIQSIPPIHYLAHHIVKRQEKPGRIVCDASAKLKEEQSLNECMYRGPCMLQDLTALLLNFRMNKIAITADIEKAFLQVGLQHEDREVTRFLWVKDLTKPLTNDNIMHLRFTRVPFGIISSPFLLTAVIRHHIASLNNNLLEKVANNCYVDNLVTGTNSTEEAYTLYKETRRVFDDLSMNIRDWMSNDETLMQKIPEAHRMKPADNVKVLGLIWNKTDDTLQLQNKEEIINKNIKKVTKREVLRVLASIYDPCGFVSPLVLPAKLFLQELWKQDYKWDMALPPELARDWNKVKLNLQQVNNIKIPRYAAHQATERETDYELHCFTDASQCAYAAVAYLRSDNGYEVATSFLMSKVRVVPLEKEKKGKSNAKVLTSKARPISSRNKKKALTIPQLELLGYVIGNRLLTYLMKTLTIKIKKQYLWTDSSIVLSWIKSNKLLPPFVANRVNEIKQNADVEMCYINTKQNPADVATRPELWSQKQDLWLQGPSFLTKDKDCWPKGIPTVQPDDTIVSAVAEGLSELPPEIDVDEDVPDDENNMDIEITQTNINSETIDIKNLQEMYFPDEVRGKETHMSRNLDLFKDVEGILRCGGRMMHADLSYETKHPILIPKDCEYTMKIIDDIHQKNYHVGVSHTLSLVRQKYWVPQGRSQVRKVIKRCPQCNKHGGGPYRLPKTPALPPERVLYTAPFAYTGIDYFGPMMVKTDNGKEKRWVCLLTCLVIRAVHLEIVKDLTAEECLLALRRFVALRGIPTLILSDNALQFKLTAEVLNNQYCTQNKIKWRFTPELAPWHGGAYERLVGVVKHCLKRTLEKHLLNESQLQTVIREVESVVNTRPLTSVDADLAYVLKPADFLGSGKCFTVKPTGDQVILEGTKTKQDLIAGWRRGQNILKEFKEMFIGRYLLSLRERYKHNQKQPRVKSDRVPLVGDTVQIKGDSNKRQNWRVGKISSLVLGPDGECRVAKVKIGDTEFTRSIGHLYPLEAEMDGEPRITTREEVVESEVDDLGEKQTNEPRHLNEMEVGEISNPTEKRNDVSRMEERDDSHANNDGADKDLLEMSGAPESSNIDAEGNCEGTETAEAENEEERVKRAAAVKAREKIAEMYRQFVALL